MSEQEMNICTRCNLRHDGNGELCGICQDTIIANLTAALHSIEAINKQLRAKLVTVKGEIGRLREALQVYGEHSHSCQETSEQQHHESLDVTCSCGFEQVLKDEKESMSEKQGS